jgi:hypothetical protein
MLPQRIYATWIEKIISGCYYMIEMDYNKQNYSHEMNKTAKKCIYRK